MKTQMHKWLETPPAQWPNRFSSAASGQVPDVCRELEGMIQRAVLLEYYLDSRQGGNGHEFAVKSANKALIRVRRAMRYSMPKVGAISF